LKKEEGRRKKEEGRRKNEEGRRESEEGKGKGDILYNNFLNLGFFFLSLYQIFSISDFSSLIHNYQLPITYELKITD
jgi:hypothetical protein